MQTGRQMDKELKLAETRQNAAIMPGARGGYTIVFSSLISILQSRHILGFDIVFFVKKK